MIPYMIEEVDFIDLHAARKRHFYLYPAGYIIGSVPSSELPKIRT